MYKLTFDNLKLLEVYYNTLVGLTLDFSKEKHRLQSSGLENSRLRQYVAGGSFGAE